MNNIHNNLTLKDKMYEKEYFTPQQAADRMKVSKQTVLKMIRNGTLPVLRLGYRTIRIPVSSLNNYIYNNTN